MFLARQVTEHFFMMLSSVRHGLKVEQRGVLESPISIPLSWVNRLCGVQFMQHININLTANQNIQNSI